MIVSRAALRSVIVALFCPCRACRRHGQRTGAIGDAAARQDRPAARTAVRSRREDVARRARRSCGAAAGRGRQTGQSAMAPAGISSALDMIRGHIKEMVDAVPTLPAQFARAWTILELEFEGVGLVGIVALILGLVAVGLGLVWIVFRLTQGYRDWMKAMPKGTPQGRVRSLGARLVYGAIMIAGLHVRHGRRVPGVQLAAAAARDRARLSLRGDRHMGCHDRRPASCWCRRASAFRRQRKSASSR